MRRARQIIAMGGGRFCMEPRNPLFDRYVLAQASGDSRPYIHRFKRFFLGNGGDSAS
ncbi:hypothetical protein EDC32_10521 [Laceyella sacchari]|jgi:hypothetical protein|nr:hypothetical protein EDC32_10521 [Laceyella sacchari]